MAITTPFAHNGDKKEIPQTSSDGSLSFDKGFGSLYALPPEEGGLFIDREQFNQLMYDTTSQVLENKQQIATQANRINEVNTTLTQSINTKANQATTYTKTEVNNLVNPKADKSTTYTKSETNNLLNAKANANNVYTKSEVDTKVNAKANANAVVNISGDQSIRDIKTFLALPVCNLAPTANNHLANKAYVDSIVQVPNYSGAITIRPNEAFTAQFNGVVEIYADFTNFADYDAAGGLSVSLGASLDRSKVILGCSSGAISCMFFGGQAIIIKGQQYYFAASILNLYRAVIVPFKSVTQQTSTRSATMARNPPPQVD